MPSGRDSFRRNRVAPSVPFYFSTSARHMDARKLARSYSTVKFTERQRVATCMFNVRGLPLQYNRQSIGQKLTETDYEAIKTRGISHTMSFAPKPLTARVRLLVCDTRMGMIGSVDLPYPARVISASAAQPAKSAGEADKAAGPISPSTPAIPHVIKFYGKEGRSGMLEWSAERIVYSGDMQPEASAKALFDSLWAKSYSCESGRLLSVSDKTTPAPQPLHFRADDSHSASATSAPR